VGDIALRWGGALAVAVRQRLGHDVGHGRPLCGLGSGISKFSSGSIFTVKRPQSGTGFRSLPGANGKRTRV